MSFVEKVLKVVNDPMFRKVMPWVFVVIVTIGASITLYKSCDRSLDKSPNDPTNDVP